MSISLLEQVKLTSTLGCFSKLSNENTILVIDEQKYIRGTPYYTPFFVLNDGKLSIPIYDSELKSVFNMEDEIIEIVKNNLIPKGIIKEVVIEHQKVDYYEKNAVEIFIICGILYYIIDIHIKEVNKWDRILYNDHRIVNLIKNLLNAELTDSKYSVNVKDFK